MSSEIGFVCNMVSIGCNCWIPFLFVDKWYFAFSICLATFHFLFYFIILLSRATNMSLTRTCWGTDWRSMLELCCWLHGRVSLLVFFFLFQFSNIRWWGDLLFIQLPIVHNNYCSVRGSCMHEWFQVNSAGVKEKLTENGGNPQYLKSQLIHLFFLL